MTAYQIPWWQSNYNLVNFGLKFYGMKTMHPTWASTIQDCSMETWTHWLAGYLHIACPSRNMMECAHKSLWSTTTKVKNVRTEDNKAWTCKDTKLEGLMAPVKPVSSELPATVSLQSTAIYFTKKNQCRNVLIWYWPNCKFT